MTNEVQTRPLAVIYRCKAKGCKFIKRTEIDRYECEEGRVNQVAQIRYTVKVIRYGQLRERSIQAMTCPDCSRFIAPQSIQGRVIDTIKCGARCVNAVGPACDCQCGGENHARSFA